MEGQRGRGDGRAGERDREGMEGEEKGRERGRKFR